ncbi:plancitoxin-1-like isoform X2 [Amphiura filiformis]
MDEHTNSDMAFQKSKVSLMDGKQAIGYTLQQVYGNQKSKKVGYGMYNDQPPPEKKSTKKSGHTKGVVGFDSTGGFWLVHSVPHFPSHANDGYGWPTNANRYGQTFLCISVSFQQFEQIGRQLRYNCPHFYDIHMPAEFPVKLPSLHSALLGVCDDTSPHYNIATLTATNGQNFVSFAKSKSFSEDLYRLVAKEYHYSLYTETWQRGNDNKIASYCNYPKVINIKNVQVGKYKFSSAQDHSKWAVTAGDARKPPSQQAVCIGDINREKTQLKRAGGTVCMDKVLNVWRAFREAILGAEICTNSENKQKIEKKTRDL